MIFPNEDDRSLHDFTGDCNNGTNGTTQVENDLCVCAPGYQLDSKSRSCGKNILKKSLKFLFSLFFS